MVHGISSLFAFVALMVFGSVAVACGETRTSPSTNEVQLLERLAEAQFHGVYLATDIAHQESGRVDLYKSGTDEIRSDTNWMGGEGFSFAVAGSEAFDCSQLINGLPSDCQRYTDSRNVAFRRELVAATMGLPTSFDDMADFARRAAQAPSAGVHFLPKRTIRGMRSSCFVIDDEVRIVTLCIDQDGVLTYSQLDDGVDRVQFELVELDDDVTPEIFRLVGTPGE